MPDPSGAADQATAHYRRANALKDGGQPEAALTAYDEALALRPDYAHALCNRGVVLAALGRGADALASYDRALALEPSDALTHYNRGALLLGMGQADAALASYEAAATLEPSLFHAHLLCGNLQQQRGALDAAIECYGRAIAARPDVAEGWFNRGVLFQKRGQLDAAVQDFDRAVALNPALYQAWYNRGNALRELRRHAEALQSYDAAIAVRADYAEAWCNRGVALQELRRHAEALQSYERASALRPDYARAYFNRGMLQYELAQYEAAIASFDQAIAVRPDDAEAHCSRGAALIEVRDVGAAIASYERALAIQPDFEAAHYNRAMALLLAGDYAAGWPEYEWRWRNTARLSISDRPPFPQPHWLGREDIAGRRILLWNEQGLGDTLQFCRYAREVASRGAHVILDVQAPLAGLLASLEGVAQLVVTGSESPPFDLHCPLMSLPAALGTTLQTVPPPPRQLRADPVRVAAWQVRLGARGRPRIGLVWSGNANQGNDRNRSVPLAGWLPHLPRGYDYICLQKEIRAADRGILGPDAGIRTFADSIADFSDTAALAQNCDLVISVCTSVLHLAGTLGLRTWALLCFNADWRWLERRSDSPWYPTMRLYRQPRYGDWQDVFTRVAADLRREFG